ncbi:hypothetical protein SELMODRAFT_412170 [Selaginella moellendorffii]|uniref:Uncharacterized protein n=1 Tax=Selaginella moellendorffii TaxID=88036 RepID=D8RKA3_SELML|nr:hypothetical protein SELMODRAFT_412170 [Selaginella moellendorffii]
MSFNGVLEWKALLAAYGVIANNDIIFVGDHLLASQDFLGRNREDRPVHSEGSEDFEGSRFQKFQNFGKLFTFLLVTGPETPELLSASFGNEPLLCSGIWITLYSILVLLLEKVYLKFQFTSRKVQHIDTRIDYCTNASRNKSSSCYLTVLLHLLNDRVIHSVVTHGSQVRRCSLANSNGLRYGGIEGVRPSMKSSWGGLVACFAFALRRKIGRLTAECHPCERAGLFWLVDLKAKLKSGASQQECGHILGQSIWRKQQRGYIQSSLVFIQMGAKLKGGGVGDGGDRKKRKRGMAWEGFGKLWSFLSIPEFTPPHSPQLRGAKKQQARLEPAPSAFLYEDAPVTDMPSPSPRCVRVSGWLRRSIVLLLAPDVPYSMTPRQRRKRHVTQSLDGLALDPCHSNSKTGAAAAQRHSNDLSREPSWTTADYGRGCFLQRQAICGVSFYSSASNLHPERHGCKAELNTRWTGPCASRARHQSSYRNPEAAFNGQTYTANQLEDTATHTPLLLLLPLLLLHFAFPGITRATRLHQVTHLQQQGQTLSFQTKQRKSPTLDPSGGAVGRRKRFSHLLLPNLNIFANVQSNKGKEWRLGI